MSGAAADALTELLNSTKEEIRKAAETLSEAASILSTLHETLEFHEQQYVLRLERDPLSSIEFGWGLTAIIGEPEEISGKSAIAAAQQRLHELSYQASLSRDGGYTIPGEGDSPDWVTQNFANNPLGQFVGGFASGIGDAAGGAYQTLTHLDQVPGNVSTLAHNAWTKPTETLTAILDVEGFDKNPSRWLGTFASGAALSALGGAAATASKTAIKGTKVGQAISRLEARGLQALKGVSGAGLRFIDSIKKIPANVILRLSPAHRARIERITNILNGKAFDKLMSPKYGKYNQIYLEITDPTNGIKKRVIVDSYAHNKSIVSRKYTQLNEIQLDTAKAYIREARSKYRQNFAIVSDTPKAREMYPELIGKHLKGELRLEVPEQLGDLNSTHFREIIQYAELEGEEHVTIVNDFGRVYN